MFGDNTAVLQTEHEDEKDHTLNIPIIENGVEHGVFRLDFQTGIVSMTNTEGNLLFQEQLDKENSARFTTMDPMAEKYYSISPYVYCANNPLKYVDHRGDSISLADIQLFDKNNGTTFLQIIINDLQNQTGLTYSVNARGMLTYNTNEDGSPVISTTTDQRGNVVQQGSETARNFMKETISHLDKVDVVFGAKSGVPQGTNTVGLNPGQINNFIAGSSGVDSRTLGWGMTLMHELHHTQIGGGLSDSPYSSGNPGPVVTQMNIIRGELDAKGGNYGQRIDYPSTPTGLGSSVLPFSNAASRTLRTTGLIPVGLPYLLIR